MAKKQKVMRKFQRNWLIFFIISKTAQTPLSKVQKASGLNVYMTGFVR